MVCSIFIASSTSSGAPRATRSPAATGWRTILPGIGAAEHVARLVLRLGERQRVQTIDPDPARRREQVKLLAALDTRVSVPGLAVEPPAPGHRPRISALAAISRLADAEPAARAVGPRVDLDHPLALARGAWSGGRRRSAASRRPDARASGDRRSAPPAAATCSRCRHRATGWRCAKSRSSAVQAGASSFPRGALDEAGVDPAGGKGRHRWRSAAEIRDWSPAHDLDAANAARRRRSAVSRSAPWATILASIGS